MTATKKAIESRDVRLTPDEIAKLKGICEQTLRAQPQLSAWVKNIEVAPHVTLPFLPIRCFRLTNVSRFAEPKEPAQREWLAEFLSSGSTQALRARHRMSQSGLEAYRKSAIEGWRYACKRLGIPPQTIVLSLVPPGESVPDSSLSMMLSLWRDAGVVVQFVDMSQGPVALENCVRKLQTLPHGASEFVIFGTSLHHLQVLQWQRNERNSQPFIEATRVWCFDTGGTKGRTQTTNQTDLYEGLRGCFSPECDLQLLSEYGMCELSSQAYAMHAPHGDLFISSPQLKAVAIAAQLDRILPHGQKGFLGFIDSANVDSWPCLISEDLGMTLASHDGCFRLAGRAPDATLKGCSLNVRDTYRFDLEAQGTVREPEKPSATGPAKENVFGPRNILAAKELLAQLSQADWPEYALRDLKASLTDWDAAQALTAAFPSKLINEDIAIVTSANIPVTWLFPAVHAWHMKARSITLYLPSLRPDDPLTALVRRQIVSLAAAFNTLTGKNFIRVQQHRLLSNSRDSFVERILVFGSDETLSALSAQLRHLNYPAQLVALGHFQNSLRLDNSRQPAECAKLCSLWLGRGCLTPLQLEIPDAWERNQSDSFASEFYHAMRNLRQKYIESVRNCGVEPLQEFSHQHNLTEVRALASAHNLKFDIAHCSDTGTVVVATTQCDQLPQHILAKLNDFAGCGWVNVVAQQQAAPLPLHNPTPGLCEPHQGTLWRDWFFKTKPNAE